MGNNFELIFGKSVLRSIFNILFYLKGINNVNTLVLSIILPNMKRIVVMNELVISITW